MIMNILFAVGFLVGFGSLIITLMNLLSRGMAKMAATLGCGILLSLGVVLMAVVGITPLTAALISPGFLLFFISTLIPKDENLSSKNEDNT